MTPPRVQWRPDPGSAEILAAFARHGEDAGSVLRRALRLLAIADGLLDPRGRIRRHQRQEAKP